MRLLKYKERNYNLDFVTRIDTTYPYDTYSFFFLDFTRLDLYYIKNDTNYLEALHNVLFKEDVNIVFPSSCWQEDM